MSYVSITKKEMDEKLKAEKGWICNTSGNEYVYDFHLLNIPVIIKVMSSIRIDTKKSRNKGSDAIRVFAVVKDKMEVKGHKVVNGLAKSTRLNRVTNWRDNVEKAVKSKIIEAKKKYKKWYG